MIILPEYKFFMIIYKNIVAIWKNSFATCHKNMYFYKVKWESSAIRTKVSIAKLTCSALVLLP